MLYSFLFARFLSQSDAISAIYPFHVSTAKRIKFLCIVQEYFLQCELRKLMSNHKARKKPNQSEMDTEIPANLWDIRASFWESLRRLCIPAVCSLSAMQASGLETPENFSGPKKLFYVY